MKNKAKLFIYFEFYGNDIPIMQFKEIWNNKDTFFSNKGDFFTDFSTENCERKQREYDYCNIRFEVNQESQSLSDILLEAINHNLESIINMNHSYNDLTKKIHVCIYPENEQYNIEISKFLISKLQELDLEFEMSIINL